MDLFSNLSLGFSQALTIQNLIYCSVGVLYGTMIGISSGQRVLLLKGPEYGTGFHYLPR